MENSLDHELLGILPPKFAEIEKIKQDISDREDKMIRDIFPVKTWITPWALFGNRLNPTDCVGVRTLRRVLKRKGIDIKVGWIDNAGCFIFNNKQYIVSSNVNMMDQFLPRKVTLQLIN